jgi:hypothetical protein
VNYLELFKSIVNVAIGTYTQLAIEDKKRGAQNERELRLGRNIGHSLVGYFEEKRSSEEIEWGKKKLEIDSKLQLISSRNKR